MPHSQNSIDAIIIGGGHNGLVCAYYLATKGLKVNMLIRGEEEAIREITDQSADISALPVDYYKIYVEYDIEGKFPDYLNLKEEIAELDKLIVFEKEEVTTTDSRTVIANVKISLVRMPTR